MNTDAAQRFARRVGVLYVVTIVVGGWGESYAPSWFLVADDLNGTAHRVADDLWTFRASFVAYLIEACCDVTLNVLLYVLLRPVSRYLALTALCFGLIATAIYAAGELVYFAAAIPATDGDVASHVPSDIKTAVTYLCLTIYGYVNGIFAVFYGTAASLRGLMMYRSGYLPRTFGLLFIAGGAGFVCKNVLVVLAPAYDVPYVLFPMFLAMLAWALYFIVGKIDPAEWARRQDVFDPIALP